ncbi:LAMI_0E15368g1_1 [Lachancea mirantina]|uniref:LAMI_0E15368g1_1 n=1 Tax=Lachancea mirantina TaxID=1230905 RepID=A0A1G4JSN1_9SACH|nr:LAMI_0E15368g1_1 [Lachancea mirantina]
MALTKKDDQNAFKSVYLEAAQLLLRDRRYDKATIMYERALKSTQTLQEISEKEQDSEHVRQALSLVGDDIQNRVKELKLLEQAAQEVAQDSQNQSDRSEITAMTALREKSWTDSNFATVIETYRTSLLNLLKVQLETDSRFSTLEDIVNQNVISLLSDMGMLEQRRVAQYEAKVEHLARENKKMSNQIVKLKERWGSLVESARQKRKQEKT